MKIIEILGGVVQDVSEIDLSRLGLFNDPMKNYGAIDPNKEREGLVIIDYDCDGHEDGAFLLEDGESYAKVYIPNLSEISEESDAVKLVERFASTQQKIMECPNDKKCDRMQCHHHKKHREIRYQEYPGGHNESRCEPLCERKFHCVQVTE